MSAKLGRRRHLLGVGCVAAATIVSVVSCAGSAHAAGHPRTWAGWQTADAWINQNDNVKWYVAAPEIQQSDVGQKLNYTLGAAPVDCNTLSVIFHGSQGWASAHADVTCSADGVTASTTVTDDMVGSTPQLNGWMAVSSKEGQSVAVKFRSGDDDEASATLKWGAPPDSAKLAPADQPASPSTSPSSSPTPSSPATSPAAPSTSSNLGPAGSVGSLNLPRIPWEGANYWDQFANAKAAGWSDPSFLPITIWFESMSTDEEAKWNKSMGFNTFIGQAENTQSSLFTRNGLYYIGPKLNDSWNASTTNWVGEFAGDEIDGQTSASEGVARVKAAEANKMAGHFVSANYTQLIASKWMPTDVSSQYVNSVDAVSLDQYFYSNGFCKPENFHGDVYPPYTIDINHCRSSASYGTMIDVERARDALDGKLEPIFGFVEVLNGTDGATGFVRYISPDQVKGAAMNQIIHGARGLIYFNTSLTGSCQAGSLAAEVHAGKSQCAAAQVAAAGEVNNFLLSLAPVINTQSYKYSFGTGLDTMLKTYDGSAYIFSMIGLNSDPGSRTFKLPDELKGHKITVVGENRTITPSDDGTFTDNFASETTYHVYKIS